MPYPYRIATRSFLLVLLIATYVALSNQHVEEEKGQISKVQLNEAQQMVQKNNFQRLKRATRKPGFFKTLFSVIYEQWNDTRHTFNRVNTLVNDNFLPENAQLTTTTTSKPDANVSTTKAPFKISRSEFNKILQRNLKGLVRLYNIELKDALKQSDVNYKEYRKNATKEISRWL